MRISDWSSDVCSSDLLGDLLAMELQNIIPAVELIDGVCKGAELAGVCRRRGHDELQAQIGDELGRGQGLLVILGIESLVQHHQAQASGALPGLKPIGGLQRHGPATEEGAEIVAIARAAHSLSKHYKER